jgi:calcineurin-like phosphoesterase family protein
MNNILFTSDSHFFHAKIIEYCNRPFSSVEEMNEVLIQKWNAKVGLGDTVYHLGDFSMGPKENVNIRKRLNGKVILIKGNHDRKDAIHLAAGFDAIYKYLEIEINGHKLYLAHIPMHLDPGDRYYPPDLKTIPPTRYDYFLCGHVHDKWKRNGNTINVGVDVSDFSPLTLTELLARDNESTTK